MKILDYENVVDDRHDPRWAPLRVSCRVVTPVIYHGDGLNLDGLLAFGAYQELSEEQKKSLVPMASPWVEDFDMPVAKWSAPAPTIDGVYPVSLLTPKGHIWGWCTSDVQCEWSDRQPYDVRQMPATDAMRRLTDSKVVNTASSRYKGANKRYAGWWPVDGELVWYVLGNAEKVSKLLRHVPNIGKMHNHGYGKVECDLSGIPIWTVEEADHDYSIERDGELTRAMPEGYGGREAVGKPAPVRAPRHHRSRYVPCIR